MSDEERLVTVQGCKFVDEVRRRCARRASRSAWPRRASRAQVVPECPYVMNDEYLTMIFDKYKIDYVVHGDDPCIVNGRDVCVTRAPHNSIHLSHLSEQFGAQKKFGAHK